jgi:sugar lactone lactonase YvrE
VRGLVWLLVPVLAGCGVSATTSCEPVAGIEPVCGLQAPEDLAMIPWTRWLLLSQMPRESRPGNLAALHLENGRVLALYPREGADEPRPGWGEATCPGPPGAAFAPHGIDVEGSRLLVVGHGAREAVEVFELDAAGEEPRVIWRGCVPAPADASLNDVASLPQSGFAATKMLERSSGWGLGTMFRMLAGGNTGYVLTWSPQRGWQKVPGSEGKTPNGIAATPDGGALFFSEFMGEAVVRIAADGSARGSVALGFKPDNLTWTARGTLLAAGAAGSLPEVMACGRVAAGACQAPFGVAEIDPRALEARELLRSDGAAGGGISVALELGDELYLGAFAGDRLLRVKRDSLRAEN